MTNPTVAKHGIVATTHPTAAQIGVEVLRAGGNAIDAAIATNAAMGLMEPASCGIGGDLFAIVWLEKKKKLFGLNASGRSPYAASIDLFQELGLDEIPTHGPLSWSVPGCVDGWDQLLTRFGTRSLAELLAPAIDYAIKGFEVPPHIASTWKSHEEQLRETMPASETYLIGGRAPEVGATFSNPRLAATYRLLAKKGRDVFYRGAIAKQIVEYSRSIGGLFSLRDFREHTSTWVDPVSTTYRGYEVWEIPPPGQGIAVLQMLNILEGFDLTSLGPDSADWWHLFIEAKKLAYADRAKFYADPQVTNTIKTGTQLVSGKLAASPFLSADGAAELTQQLISKRYAAKRRKLINPMRALDDVPPGDPKLARSDTIYLTVVDKDRNCVSLIQSIFDAFGSQHAAADLGFALQNRGSLFALDLNHLNRLAPHKRPFHTIIPAFVTRRGKPYFCFGVMGGDMQPQGQVQVLVNHIDFGMNIQQAGDQPRLQHLGSATPTGRKADGGGSVVAEPQVAQSILDALAKRGHRVMRGGKNGGGYQGIRIDRKTKTLQGATESRRDGRAAGY